MKLHEGATVDLHGQYKRDAALLLTQDIFPSARSQGVRRFSVVVGAGKHSRGGSHPLATAVEGALRSGRGAGLVSSWEREGPSFHITMA